VDWLIPAYIQMGYVHRLASAIEASDEKEKLKTLREILTWTYTAEYLADFYIGRYSQLAYVKDYARQIDESIRAYFSGYKLVAITAMIPVLEGIVRKFAGGAGRDAGQGTQGIKLEFEAFVNDEAASAHRYEERLVMLEMLRDFIVDKFFANTNRYAGLDNFNRHGILHGVFEDFGEDLNFFRIITILDLLCFLLAFRGFPVSCFAPESTDESRALGAQYQALRAVPTPVPTTEQAKLFLGNILISFAIADHFQKANNSSTPERSNLSPTASAHAPRTGSAQPTRKRFGRLFAAARGLSCIVRRRSLKPGHAP
jgi:hypothetical protein